MHTVELLDHALDLAQKLGYQIRQEWLGGEGGGSCVLKGCKLFFLDLALSPREQFEQLIDVLRHDPHAADLPMPKELHAQLAWRKAG